MSTSLSKLFRAAAKNPNPKNPLSSSAAAPEPAQSSSGVSTVVFSWLKKPDSGNASTSLSSDNNDPVRQPLQSSNDSMLLKNILDVPWFSVSNMDCNRTTQHKKEVSRERKQKHLFKNTESRRFTKLMRTCADKLGTESTIEAFCKLGRETGIKEYNALIKLCIGNARHSTDKETSLKMVHKVYQLIASMREKGFQLDEESYGPIFNYLIDMGMTEEFQFVSSLIRDGNPVSHLRISYYEMLLWIKVGDEDKIQELFHCSGVSSRADNYEISESNLLAFCESDRKKELLQLFKDFDIRKISSLKYGAVIFKSLGRLQLENFTEKFVLALKTIEVGDESISSFVYDYSTSIPNVAVEELVLKFSKLHEKLGISPSIVSYDKLIALCCESFKVHAALDIVVRMCECGLDVPIETFHPILKATEQSGELDLVHPIYSVMHHHNLKPKEETFRSMISLYMKIKDFEGAYNLLANVKEMNVLSTTSMFNAIMNGYFREKNTVGALMVLKQMEEADVKPDSETFSYLISNCECENDLFKYHKEMQNSGVQVTKQIYIALINAYANFGKFELAKQVVFDKNVPAKYLNYLKSVLVSALSNNGQISDALDLYDEIKQSGSRIEPKALISLIEHLRNEGELGRLLKLLEGLNDSKSWFDGCSRVILYCIRYNLASSAIDLLKKLKKLDKSSTYMVIDQIFGHIWEMEPSNLDIGLDILRAIKEELHLPPSRTCLDFLLSTCVKAKNLECARIIWSEYINAGLSYNILTSLRMYQVLLASGERAAARGMLKRIPQDDPHIRYVINSCKTTFSKRLSADVN